MSNVRNENGELSPVSRTPLANISNTCERNCFPQFTSEDLSGNFIPSEFF